jgi:SAM-dependent methyltransferase
MNVIRPKEVKNSQYFYIGALLMILNYVRHRILGYRTPRTFSIDEIERSIDYDFKVVQAWLAALSRYSKSENRLRDKVVLELGPGPDLGIGLIILAMGAKKYVAFDSHPLAAAAPFNFYDKLFVVLSERIKDIRRDYLKEQLEKTYHNDPENLAYIVDKGFNISGLKEKPDLVFSQATFEHFSNVKKSLAELSQIAAPGCLLISEIDLKTHTSWIRDRDPLNIYRYGKRFWRTFRFNGSPNRVRTFEYKKILENNHWRDVRIEPLTVLEDHYVEKVKPTLDREFRPLDTAEMRNLSVMLMARKS